MPQNGLNVVLPDPDNAISAQEKVSSTASNAIDGLNGTCFESKQVQGASLKISLNNVRLVNGIFLTVNEGPFC